MGKKTRIIPAYHFKKEHIGDGEVNDYVNDLLGTIEDDMQQAVENELNSSKTELGTLFKVPGLSIDKARLYVYYHLIKALRNAGYTPRLERLTKLNGELVMFIHVTWLSKKDTSREKYMTDYVNHYSMTPSAKKKPTVHGRRRKRNRSE
jgi:hypothetical protein